MGLHKIGKVSTQQSKQTARRMGENLYQLYFRHRLISRIYKEHQKLNTKEINLPVNQWANKINSFQEKCKRPVSIFKRCSASQVIRERQIKTTEKLPHPIKMTIIKKSDSRCWKGFRKQESLFNAGGHAN